MGRHALLGLACLFVAAPAYGQEVTLKWKFKEGDKFFVEEVVTNKQSVTLALLPAPQKIEQKTTTLSSYTVTKVTPNSIVLVVKVENVDVRTEGGIAGQLDKIMEKTKGTSLTYTMSPEGKVSKVDGLEAMVKQLFEGQDDVAKLAQGMFQEDTFVKSVEQTFGFLPEKAVKKGDSWTRDNMVPIGPLGGFKTSNTYTYNGKVAGGEEISVKQTMQYELPKGDFAGLLKVVKGELKADAAKGSLIFDADKGRLASSSSSMQAKGNLTIDFAGQEVGMDLSMETLTTSRVLDKEPGK